MIAINIDVTDGLTNGAVGTVTNVVIEQTTGKISVILVAFDSEHVEQEAKFTSGYYSINQNGVPIHQTQATFPVDKKSIISSNEDSVSIDTSLGCHNTQMSRTCTI